MTSKLNSSLLTGAQRRSLSSHGDDETWHNVGLPSDCPARDESGKWKYIRENRIPSNVRHPYFIPNLSLESVVWLFEIAGERNHFTRDDPRPNHSTWQYYLNNLGEHVIWFKDPEIAMRFRLTWA